MAGPHAILHDIGVSAGTAAAKAAIVRPASGADENRVPYTDPVTEGERVRDALVVVPANSKERAKRTPGESAPILKAAT